MVIDGCSLRLTETECAHAALTTVRSYRQHMADYSTMRALEVWYETIGVEAVMAVQDEKTRERMRQRLEKAQERSTPEVIFPKLVEHRGDAPRIKDEPPLIVHMSAEEMPGQVSGYREQMAHYRESLPNHVQVLLDRYRLVDVAVKVVGIGSVGTACGLGLFVAADDDPLFLQIKEARPSVLEPYAGKSIYSNNGQRVVEGQRLMQSASDIFLGWLRNAKGVDMHLRQLRDVKISAVSKTWMPTCCVTMARCAPGRWRRHMHARVIPPVSPATWVQARCSTRRSRSSPLNTPTRPNATIGPS